MKIGIIQPSYLPWRGYFDFINSVDLFVFLDDVQFTRRDWRTRNKIKTRQNSMWLSVPVKHQTRGQSIVNTSIDYHQDWRNKHQNQFYENYHQAPFYKESAQLLSQISNHYSNISQLNIALTQIICQYLDIQTPMICSSELMATGQKTQKLLNIVKELNGTHYLSGPSADNYLDKALFYQYGINLEYKSYNYADYPQLWGKFDAMVSILDLIANCGPESQQYIHSLASNQLIIQAT